MNLCSLRGCNTTLPHVLSSAPRSSPTESESTVSRAAVGGNQNEQQSTHFPTSPHDFTSIISSSHLTLTWRCFCSQGDKKKKVSATFLPEVLAGGLRTEPAEGFLVLRSPLIWDSVLMCSLEFVSSFLVSFILSPLLHLYIYCLHFLFFFIFSSSLSTLWFLSVAQQHSTFSCTIIYLYRIFFSLSVSF